MNQRMKHILIAWVLMITCLLPAKAQLAKQYFVAMPDTILPLLTEINRADCIDFLESNMRAQVTNRLDGKSEMTKLADNYIAMNVSAQSRWQMKLLALNDTTQIICTISTVCAPACDSRINFYSTQWELLQANDYMPNLPTLEEYLPALTEENADVQTINVVKQADLLLVDMQMSADNDSIICTFDTPKYMEKEAAQKLMPLLQKPIIYDWDSGRFRRK